MTNRAIKLSIQRFSAWLAQAEKPIEIVALITIFATTVFLYWIGARDVASVSAICLVIAVANMPNRFRQIEKWRRNKEILNRFASEQNRKPLGL
jgi:hypothetical protein